MKYKCLQCKKTFTPKQLLKQTTYAYLPRDPTVVCDSCEPEDYRAIQSTVKIIAQLAK